MYSHCSGIYVRHHAMKRQVAIVPDIEQHSYISLIRFDVGLGGEIHGAALASAPLIKCSIQL